MRNIAVLCGALAICSMGAELPICEEFSEEHNISCVREGDKAVITALHADGTKSIEFFKGYKKAYLEIGSDGSIYASSGIRHLSLKHLPVEGEDVEPYIYEVLLSVVEDIAFK